jgi:hypothetical protein
MAAIAEYLPAAVKSPAVATVGAILNRSKN